MCQAICGGKNVFVRVLYAHARWCWHESEVHSRSWFNDVLESLNKARVHTTPVLLDGGKYTIYLEVSHVAIQDFTLYVQISRVVFGAHVHTCDRHVRSHNGVQHETPGAIFDKCN